MDYESLTLEGKIRMNAELVIGHLSQRAGFELGMRALRTNGNSLKKRTSKMVNKTRYMIFLVTLLFASVGVFAQTGGLRIESIDLDKKEIVLSGCPAGYRQAEGTCDDSPSVRVKVKITGDELKNVRFDQTVSGGRIVQGSEKDQFVWDLSSLTLGTYTLVVGVAKQTANDYADVKIVEITVKKCSTCHGTDWCLQGSVSSPHKSPVTAGEKAIFVAKVNDDSAPDTIYNWTVSDGIIVSGQGSKTITVDTTGLAGRTLTATVSWPESPAGFRCPTSASESVPIEPEPKPVLVDEVGLSGLGELRARLDIYFADLKNNPDNSGVLIIYPPNNSDYNSVSRTIRNHIATRKFDASQISIVRGPKQPVRKVKFYRVPPGAESPTP